MRKDAAFLSTPDVLGGRLMHPDAPRLIDALAVGFDLDESTLREALAADNWRVDPHMGLTWTGRDAYGRAALRWTGPIRRRPVTEVWETLAARGVIPEAWVGDKSQREFFGAPRRLWPFDIETAVTLASDPEGVVTAESLAREVHSRLAPWLPPRRPSIVWRVTGLSALAYWPSGMPGGPVLQTLAGLVSQRGASEAASARVRTRRANAPRPATVMFPTRLPPGNDMHWFDFPQQGVINAAMTLEHVALSWSRETAGRVWPEVIPTPGGGAPVPGALIGRRIADTPDPFEALVGLWRLGYALEWVTHKALTLIALRAI